MAKRIQKGNHFQKKENNFTGDMNKRGMKNHFQKVSRSTVFSSVSLTSFSAHSLMFTHTFCNKWCFN